MGTDTKTCTKCGQQKPLNDFYNHSTTTDGKQGHCKVCVAETSRYRRRRKGMKAHMPKGFSTDRHCAVCSKTKHWTKYHVDAGMCADCWRSQLSEEATGDTEQPLRRTKKKNTVQDIIDFIDGLTEARRQSNEIGHDAVN